MPVLAELFPKGIAPLFEWNQGPLGINKVVVMAFVSTAICLFIFLWGARKRALVPAGLQNVAEAGYDAVEQNIAVEVIGGEDGRKWTPFLASMFFFIFFINIWGVVPGIQFPATSRIAIPVLLALVSWVVFIAVGFKHQGPLYPIKACAPSGVPKALLPLVFIIEFFSKFLVRPFSLAVRLFANMVAGHVLLTVFAVMAQELLHHPSGWYQLLFVPFPFFGLVFMTAFEILVALLQAYIFTMLTAVYIGESAHPDH
jgi:F-type H+-transporting ATPase subunit a